MKRNLSNLLSFVLIATASARAELVVSPESIEFTDAFARQQLLVHDGQRGVTRGVSFVSSNDKVVAVDEAGYVRPTGVGEATIRVGGKKDVVVRVTQFDEGRTPDFATEIVPLLTRYGCNSGSCHGKARGLNGFKLSLLGFDPAFDYDALVKEARGRRVFATSPEASLLLAKSGGAVPHRGGRILHEDSEPYQMIHAWIAAGCPSSPPDAPKVAKLHITPPQRIMEAGWEQQLRVEVEYSNGSRRDVTRETEYSSSLDVVAKVDENALVTAGKLSGEATIMARYMGQVAVFSAIRPYGKPTEEIAGWNPVNYVDTLTAAKWAKLGLQPSPVADDATFLRRVTVDLCGRLPTVDEAKQFWADKSSDKRTKLVDRLLDSPDYPAYFALKWGSILRNSRSAGADQATYAFHNWIKDMIARNRPYDEFVRGVVAAAGEWQDAPAINWYWQMRDDQLHQVTADTAQVFLGVRLQCARCHQHPYERWGQDDYFGLAAFFMRLGRKSFGQPPPYFSSTRLTSSEKHPLTGKTPEPKYPDGEYVSFTPEQDPRHGLVDWMAKPDNAFFARALVNRMWGHFFGRGLVDEVDDIRATNPPSNPALLSALERDFVKHGFDVKHIIRTIATSRTYQLSSEPTELNRGDRENFARFYARRLIAEVFLDAVDQATGSKTRFSGVSANARAVDLPHEGFGSYFLDTFDRPRRVSGCECERSSAATLAQVLLLANSDEIENKLATGNGRIAQLANAKKPTDAVVDELYLASLARYPTAEESSAMVRYVEGESDKRKAMEDVLWTILNSKEFMFNH